MVADAASFAPGDRVVWTSTPATAEEHAAVFPGSTAGPPPALVFRGEFVADGPMPFVTVLYDGESTTSQVFADQLSAEESP